MSPLIFSLVAWTTIAAASPPQAPLSSGYQESASAKAVGGALGGTFQTGVVTSTQNSGQNQAVATALVDIMGFGLQALSALASPPNTINGVTYTEVYSFGKRVFSQDLNLSYGLNSVTIGLAPVEVRVPIVVYPVGPIPLEIDGGARFQGDLKVQVNPTIFVPISMSSVGLNLQTGADAAGFIEGYANFLVVRAGVGGQVNLVDAAADLNTEFWFNGQAPAVTVSATVDFLSGEFYAFLDYFSLASFGWKRLLNYDLYSWKGYCFATGGAQCP